MKKICLGLLLGAIAGILDIIPMIAQKLTLDAVLSAFSFWAIAGLFIAASDIRLKGALKGIAVSMLMLVPLAVIIGWKEPASLVPIAILNLVFGFLLGFLIDKYGK